jgi:hypothetical protein
MDFAPEFNSGKIPAPERERKREISTLPGPGSRNFGLVRIKNKSVNGLRA